MADDKIDFQEGGIDFQEDAPFIGPSPESNPINQFVGPEDSRGLGRKLVDKFKGLNSPDLYNEKPGSAAKEEIRSDNTIFSIDPTGLNNKISNQASKLPRSLQNPAAFLGTALTNIPIDIAQAFLGAPESPALGIAGGISNANKSALQGRLKSITNQKTEGLPLSLGDKTGAKITTPEKPILNIQRKIEPTVELRTKLIDKEKEPFKELQSKIDSFIKPDEIPAKPKDAPPNQRAKILRGMHDPIDVIFSDPFDREIFGSGQKLTSSKSSNSLIRFRDTSERIAQTYDIPIQESRRLVHEYNAKIRELSKSQPPEFETGTGRIDAPKFSDFLAGRAPESQSKLNKLISNEKGSIGDQSGPKTLNKLQENKSEIPTLYHGTRNVFNEFNPAKSQPSELFPGAVKFTENPEYSQLYSLNETPSGMKRSPGTLSENRPNTIAANIKPKNILDLTKPIPEDQINTLKQIHPELSNYDLSSPDIAQSLLSSKKDLPFDAIKYTEHGQTNWAVPNTTEINSKYGGRLNKLLSNESGELRLRGKSSEEISKVRSTIIDAITTGRKIDISSLYKTVEGRVSFGQFNKIVDDIISSRDLESLSSRTKSVDTTPMQMSSSNTAIDNLMNKVNEHISARTTQDLAVKAEKAKRFGRLANVKSEGTQGYIDRLRTLKGAYPKEELQSLNLDPADIDDVHTQIQNLPDFTPIERARTAIAFEKTLKPDGALQPNELDLFKRAFGSQTATQLAQMNSGFNPRGMLDHLIERGQDAKSLILSADLGWPLRQSKTYIGRQSWFKGLSPGVKAYFSNASAENSMKLIESHPLYEKAKESGLDLTKFGIHSSSLKEETKPSDIGDRMYNSGRLGKIASFPILGSERSMTVGMDTIRMAEFANQNKSYSKYYDVMKEKALRNNDKDLLQEIEKYNPENPYVSEKIAESINTATMRSKLPKKLQSSAEVANALLISPRALVSNVKTINKTMNPLAYIRANRMERIDAFKQLLSMGGLIAAGNSLLALKGGKTEDNMSSTEFLKSKLGNTAVDMSGGTIPLIVAATRLATGVTTDSKDKSSNLGDYGVKSGVQVLEDATINNRLAPAANLIATVMLNKSEFGGRPLNLTSLNPLENTMTRQLLVPIIIQDMYDLSKSDPELLPWLILPDALGVGVSTYKTEPREKKDKPKLIDLSIPLPDFGQPFPKKLKLPTIPRPNWLPNSKDETRTLTP